MSITYIPEKIKICLWGKAGGRCEYEGCNTRLWLDELTQCEFNSAYIAHIIADSPGGPRGHATFSEELKSSLSNLMLMCDKHHRLIDKGDVDGHPVDRLRAMKLVHEKRIDILTGIAPDKQSHILLYGANIGVHRSMLSFEEASRAMVPNRYPASQHPINVGIGNSSFQDKSEEYWKFEVAQIRNVVEQQLKPQIAAGLVSHLSVFALAPQPLLMVLGSELSDIPFAEVYQRRKEPQSWTWEEDPAVFEYSIEQPSSEREGDVALVFSLSATVNDERVSSVVGSEMPIWKVTIPEPNNDFVRSPAQTEVFRGVMRSMLDKIKSIHGERAIIHVFPAMPVSLAVDFGRVRNGKADLPLMIYDENKSLGGFVPAVYIGN